MTDSAAQEDVGIGADVGDTACDTASDTACDASGDATGDTASDMKVELPSDAQESDPGDSGAQPSTDTAP